MFSHSLSESSVLSPAPSAQPLRLRLRGLNYLQQRLSLSARDSATPGSAGATNGSATSGSSSAGSTTNSSRHSHSRRLSRSTSPPSAPVAQAPPRVAAQPASQDSLRSAGPETRSPPPPMTSDAGPEPEAAGTAPGTDAAAAPSAAPAPAPAPTASTASVGMAGQAGGPQAAVAPAGETTSGTSTPSSYPSIRFSAHVDPRAARPSLSFTPISRGLRTGNEIIKVGRHSDRDTNPPVPANCSTAAPVGFKSKVVSRRHCEFWYDDGKWYIKDVKSSSGTFLNHIRLSAPNTESRPFVVNDGDIVQLGIDFKGGEEMMYRCVKMRLELNRAWQNKPNAFNVSTHQRLRTLGVAGTAGSSSQDCTICLNSIAPCQSLFVAPCSHTWHYKCVRMLLRGPSYPIFNCPNCRATADLEADVDDPPEGWAPELEKTETNVPPAETASDVGALAEQPMPVLPEGLEDAPSAAALGNTPTAAVPIPARTTGTSDVAASESTPGPMTPRNNIGPWVFDGVARSSPLAAPSVDARIDAVAGPLPDSASDSGPRDMDTTMA